MKQAKLKEQEAEENEEEEEVKPPTREEAFQKPVGIFDHIFFGFDGAFYLQPPFADDGAFDDNNLETWVIFRTRSEVG